MSTCSLREQPVESCSCTGMLMFSTGFCTCHGIWDGQMEIFFSVGSFDFDHFSKLPPWNVDPAGLLSKYSMGPKSRQQKGIWASLNLKYKKKCLHAHQFVWLQFQNIQKFLPSHVLISCSGVQNQPKFHKASDTPVFWNSRFLKELKPPSTDFEQRDVARNRRGLSLQLEWFRSTLRTSETVDWSKITTSKGKNEYSQEKNHKPRNLTIRKADAHIGWLVELTQCLDHCSFTWSGPNAIRRLISSPGCSSLDCCRVLFAQKMAVQSLRPTPCTIHRCTADTHASCDGNTYILGHIIVSYSVPLLYFSI